MQKFQGLEPQRSHATDLKISTLVAAQPDVLCWKISARTCWPSVSVLWQDDSKFDLQLLSQLDTHKLDKVNEYLHYILSVACLWNNQEDPRRLYRKKKRVCNKKFFLFFLNLLNTLCSNGDDYYDDDWGVGGEGGHDNYSKDNELIVVVVACIGFIPVHRWYEEQDRHIKHTCAIWMCCMCCSGVTFCRVKLVSAKKVHRRPEFCKTLPSSSW